MWSQYLEFSRRAWSVLDMASLVGYASQSVSDETRTQAEKDVSPDPETFQWLPYCITRALRGPRDSSNPANFRHSPDRRYCSLWMEKRLQRRLVLVGQRCTSMPDLADGL